MSAVIRVNELTRILTDAAAFAGTDKKLPSINAVYLETAGPIMTAAATNRFIMGASMAQLEDESDSDFMVGLRLDHVRGLLRFLKGAEVNVTVSFGAEDATFAFADRRGLTLPRFIGPGIGWREVLKNQTAEPVMKGSETDPPLPVSIGLNADYLARFSRVSRSERAVFKVSSPGKPVMVTVGEQFVGLIMPIRLGEEDVPVVPSWALPKVPTEPKVERKKKAVGKKRSADYGHLSTNQRALIRRALREAPPGKLLAVTKQLARQYGVDSDIIHRLGAAA